VGIHDRILAVPGKARTVTLANALDDRPTGPETPRPATATGAAKGSFRLTDSHRIGLAALAALCIFGFDQMTPASTLATQLYPAALLVLFGVQMRAAIAIAWFAMVVLIVIGALLEPGRLAELESGRALSIVMVSIAAAALAKLAEHERGLRWDALIDPLTGVFNRRSFLEFSAREEARARRVGTSFALLMIDIDHFKRINDTYGHQVGDTVIKELAEVATRMVRPSDILARYGGEEFVVSLPDTDADQARVVAERLRAAVEAAAVISDDGAIRFTVSIGFATCSHGTPLREAMARADQALYAAKRNGRNRVEASIAAPPDAPPPASADAPAADAAQAARAILVVDDETEIRELLAGWLRDSGYDVVTAPNASAALRMVQAEPSIALLLTDIVMPGSIDGYDLGRQAVALRPNLKLLFMSGYNTPAAQAGAPLADAPLLNKPFRMSHVLDMVAFALER
jgi:diguanylate cyclase (GGDEF)-like protein